MRKICLKIILLCCLCTILAGSRNAYAAEGEMSAKERCEAGYDKAIGLADLLRTSPYMLHNKLYTAEQEVELRKLVDSVCAHQSTDREKAWALLLRIYDRLEPGSCKELTGWDTLCDGESDWNDSSGKLVGKKKQVGEMEYCYTFYDVCRLADIPCFILSDGVDYITMIYIETDSGIGKDWYFVDVASEKLIFTSRENVYEDLGEKISSPYKIMLDYYWKLHYYAQSILLENSSENAQQAPRLVYDSDTNKVKTYFPTGILAAGEQYGRTEAYIGENGEAPSGWIETKVYSDRKVTIYRSYAVFGVFLRGRVEQDGKEYNLQQEEFYSSIPYYDRDEVKSEPESDEHRTFVNDYRKRLEDKAIAVGEALLADKNYIWDDIYFEKEEDEKLVREAVEKALDWDYIKDDEISQIAFENVGIPFVPWEEQKPELRDKARAQAILLYIKRNVESVDGGQWYVNSSADVLKSKQGICGSITLLFRDMCVMAGIPCFQMRCSFSMRVSDSLFGDHADNMLKVGDEWLFCDPTNVGLIGKGGCIQLSFMEAYDTVPYNRTELYIDREAMIKDSCYKWYEGISTAPKDYYDFDEDGKLGIYRRNRWGEPVPTSETDENGRYTKENGLYTIDVLESTGEAEIVTRYAYQYQNLRRVKGKKIIDGTEYDFTTRLVQYGDGYHKLQEVSRKYNIAHLTFQPLEDQPYNKDGACPVPEIYHGDKKLELGKDFEIVEYRDNKELSTYQNASYKVKGIGDYTGEAARQFKIVEADVSKMDLKLPQTSFIWKPYGVRPEVEVPGLTLSDYKLEYYDSFEVGKARVVVTGIMNSATRKKNATGSITLEYEILPYEMKEEDIKAEYTETVYNGTVQKPKVTIEGFQDGKYYEVSYEKMIGGVWQEVEPKEVGEYRIVVQLTDNVELIKEGEKVPNICYINYSIHADGSGTESGSESGSTGGGTGSESGLESGSGSGSTEGGTGSESGLESGSGSGSTGGGTGSESGLENGSGSGSTEGGSGSGTENGSGSGSTGSGSGIENGFGSDSTGGGTGSGSDSGSGSGSTGGGNAGENTDGGNSGTVGDGGTGDSSISSGDTAIPKVEKVKKFKAKKQKKGLVLTWKKNAKVSGYQIQYCTKKGFKGAKKISVKGSKSKCKLSKLKAGKKYYVRIRAYKSYKTQNEETKKVYGKWTVKRIG